MDVLMMAADSRIPLTSTLAANVRTKSSMWSIFESRDCWVLDEIASSFVGCCSEEEEKEERASTLGIAHGMYGTTVVFP